MAERILNHYAAYAFTDAYWGLTETERKNVRTVIAEGLKGATEACHLYNLFPQRADSDFLVWSAWGVDEPTVPKTALTGYAHVVEHFRHFVTTSQTLWGFTRASQYSRGKSEQDMDPFDEHRTSYLVIYPFSKTKEWYLMSMDARQGMMNEHIKIGKQYFDIKQLLLYSFGLQDHEFVVSYEVEDLLRFSELVNVLRNTEGRRYTLLDTPIITGVYQTPEEFIR